MPVLGYYLGAVIGDAVQAYAGFIAGAVFLVLAGRLLWEAFHEEESESGMGWAELLPLGVATSIDAFAIGVVVKLVGQALWPVVIAAGVVTAALSGGALLLGGVLGKLSGSRTAIRAIGALVLAALGVDALLGA
jgi:putative Mn2+ efflux pump MntP